MYSISRCSNIKLVISLIAFIFIVFAISKICALIFFGEKSKEINLTIIRVPPNAILSQPTIHHINILHHLSPPNTSYHAGPQQSYPRYAAGYTPQQNYGHAAYTAGPQQSYPGYAGYTPQQSYGYAAYTAGPQQHHATTQQHANPSYYYDVPSAPTF